MLRMFLVFALALSAALCGIAEFQSPEPVSIARPVDVLTAPVRFFGGRLRRGIERRQERRENARSARFGRGC